MKEIEISKTILNGRKNLQKGNSSMNNNAKAIEMK